MFGTKTLWGSIAVIVSAAGAYFAGEITLIAALTLAIPAVLAIFIRDGIQKVIKKVGK